jgi:preprotein translocase subunit SecF
MALRAFLTTVMCLLSLLVLFLGLIVHSAFWLWVGFVCALISGIFLQLFISRREKKEETESKQHRGTP